MSSDDQRSRSASPEGQESEQKTVKNSYEGMKGQKYISWNDYFMGIAALAARRSKDPRTKVGACIVDEDNKIVGVGYNGMPGGLDDAFPWQKNEHSFLEDKLTYVCHAEMNAFMNAVPKDTKNCNLYVTLFPCHECAKIIIQAKIKEVIYLKDRKDDKTKAAKRMFNKMKIKYSSFKTDTPKIIIEFDDSN